MSFIFPDKSDQGNRPTNRSTDAIRSRNWFVPTRRNAASACAVWMRRIGCPRLVIVSNGSVLNRKTRRLTRRADRDAGRDVWRSADCALAGPQKGLGDVRLVGSETRWQH